MPLVPSLSLRSNGAGHHQDFVQRGLACTVGTRQQIFDEFVRDLGLRDVFGLAHVR